MEYVFGTPSASNLCFITTVSHTLGQTKHLPMDASAINTVIIQALVIALKKLEVQPKNDPAKI